MNPADTPTGFKYSKTHQINGSTDGVLTNYPVKITVHNGMGIDQGLDVYLNGHSSNWPDDIRFTTDGDDLLSFWIESYDNNLATIWVKVPYIPASPGSTVLKIFYGNTTAASGSNGAATWTFFDDFDTLDATHWTNTGNIVISDGTVNCYASGDVNSILSSQNYLTSVYTRVLAHVKTEHWSDTGYTEVLSVAYSNDKPHPRALEADFSNKPEYAKSHTYVNWIDGSPLGYYTIYGWSAGTWHTIEAKRLTDMIRWSVDNGPSVNCTRTYWTDPGKVQIYAFNDGAGISVDWICIGPVAANEPAQGSWGKETSQSSPICASLFGIALLPLVIIGIRRIH